MTAYNQGVHNHGLLAYNMYTKASLQLFYEEKTNGSKIETKNLTFFSIPILKLICLRFSVENLTRFWWWRNLSSKSSRMKFTLKMEAKQEHCWVVIFDKFSTKLQFHSNFFSNFWKLLLSRFLVEVHNKRKTWF